MTYLQIVDHHGGTVKTIETPLTLREFVLIHWDAWGFYGIRKAAANKYLIYNKFENNQCYTVAKVKKGDMQK